jgi:hypothetical protein
MEGASESLVTKFMTENYLRIFFTDSRDMVADLQLTNTLYLYIPCTNIYVNEYR